MLAFAYSRPRRAMCKRVSACAYGMDILSFQSSWASTLRNLGVLQALEPAGMLTKRCTAFASSHAAFSITGEAEALAPPQLAIAGASVAVPPFTREILYKGLHQEPATEIRHDVR